MIGALAARQHGVVARAQLVDAGVTPSMLTRMIANGQLVRLHRGVYAVGHAHLRAEGHWLAAVLAVGRGAALSHASAAALHELRPTAAARPDVSTPRERRVAGIRVHGRRALAVEDVTARHGIPVTTVARTLVDLAATLRKHQLAKALSEAERQGKLDATALDDARRRTRGRHGAGHAALDAAMEDLRAHGPTFTRSELEDRFLALLDVHRIPRPRMNAHVAGMEVDALWAAARLVVELDGYAFHRTRAAFQRDRERGNDLTASGYTVLRFTHADVTRRPARTAARITRALGSAGPPRRAGRPAP